MKMATKCKHDDIKNYSNGLCQKCYSAQYYYMKKEKKTGIKRKADEHLDDSLNEITKVSKK